MRKIRKHIKNVLTNGVSLAEHMMPLAIHYHGPTILKKNKYGNIPVVEDGQLFHSLSEWKRYRFLLADQNAGLISDLKCQVCFQFPRHKYIADFTYHSKTGVLIIEDVKSPQLENSPRYQKNKALIRQRGHNLYTISPTRLLQRIV